MQEGEKGKFVDYVSVRQKKEQAIRLKERMIRLEMARQVVEKAVRQAQEEVKRLANERDQPY